jgi:hypothetical protein
VTPAGAPPIDAAMTEAAFAEPTIAIAAITAVTNPRRIDLLIANSFALV